MTEYILDDTDTWRTTVWTWTQISWPGIDSTMKYASTGDWTTRATWNFTTAYWAISWDWEVYVHYTCHTNRASNSPFIVKNHTWVIELPTVTTPIVSVSDNIDETWWANANATLVRVNQELDNTWTSNATNSWYVYIWTYSWDGSSDLIVILTNDANEFVIADAVQIIEVTPFASISNVISMRNTISLSL